MGELGVKKEVKEDIAELFLEGVVIAFVDGFEEFVDFLYNHGAKGAVGLFAVPRAAAGTSEASHDLGEGTDFAHLLGIRSGGAFVESWRDECERSCSISSL